MVGGKSLTDHYTTNFILAHRFKTDLAYIDNMMPFEREIYLSLLIERLEKEAKQKQ